MPPTPLGRLCSDVHCFTYRNPTGLACLQKAHNHFSEHISDCSLSWVSMITRFSARPDGEAIDEAGIMFKFSTVTEGPLVSSCHEGAAHERRKHLGSCAHHAALCSQLYMMIFMTRPWCDEACLAVLLGALVALSHLPELLGTWNKAFRSLHCVYRPKAGAVGVSTQPDLYCQAAFALAWLAAARLACRRGYCALESLAKALCDASPAASQQLLGLTLCCQASVSSC